MTPRTLSNNIRRFCIVNASPAVVKKYSRFFKEGYDAYGLTKEKFECKAAMLLREEVVDLPLVLHAAQLLLKSGKYEETSFAIHLLKNFTDRFTRSTFSAVEQWFARGIINWAHADIMAIDIISYFLVNRIVPLEEVAAWTAVERKYQRRCVPVSMIKMLGATSDFNSLFQHIEPLMEDKDREVQQGVGWFLREAWKLRRRDTEKFLLKWKDRGARLIYQYATEKMTAAERKKFRRENTTRTH
ncbi:MAG: DNA alkylation repair protein [Ignavibacteriae bacterium]|nr:DNA alkylation repair protein [Ignavibacteriota bacterium]